MVNFCYLSSQVVLHARLNQQQYECNQLRNELSKAKQDCRNLQGTRAGLQSRLTEQDNALLQMKADLLKMGFTQQNLEAEKVRILFFFFFFYFSLFCQEGYLDGFKALPQLT